MNNSGVILSATALLLALLLTLFYPELHHDVAQYFTAARASLEGAVVGIDLVDTNPPLIITLNLPAVLLAEATGLDAGRSVHFFFTLLMFAALLCAMSILRRVYALPTRNIPATVMLLCWLHTGLLILQAGQYAQRDQLLMVFLLPAIMLAWARLEQHRISATPAVIATMFAVVAVGLKPQFLLIPLCMEVLVRYRTPAHRRAWTPELTVWSIAAAIVLLLLPLHAGLREWVFTWLPLITKYYSAYGYGHVASVTRLLRDPLTMGFLLGGIISAYYIYRKARQSLRHLASLLLLAAVLCLLLYLVQGKGWLYHRLPLWYACASLMGLALVVVTELRWREYALAASLLLLVMLLFSVPLLHTRMFAGFPDTPSTPLSRYFSEHSRKGERICVLSTDIPPASPAITYAGRLPVSRYLHAFPVAMAYSGMDDLQLHGDRAWMEQRYYRHLLADITTHAPPLVVIDTLRHVHDAPEGFTMLTWLQTKGFFDALAGQYVHVGNIEEFVVYKRNAPQSSQSTQRDFSL
jgi:hypothetical protein